MEYSNITVLSPKGTNVGTATPGETLAATAGATPVPALVIPTATTPGEPRQLNSLDMHLLDSETDCTPTHIGGIMILDSANAPDGPLDVGSLRRLFAERLHLLAPLRRRVRTVPLGLDVPYWEDCTTIDLGYHVRDVWLQEGATEEDVAEYVGRRHAETLNRSRPLWEFHLLSGLSGGRQAAYLKLHHALLDGVSAGEVLGAILDPVPSNPPQPLPDAGLRRDKTLSTLEMLTRTIPNTINRQAVRVRSVLEAGPGLLRTVEDLWSKYRAEPFTGPLTARREVAFTSLSLDQIKAVKSRVDGTINDVVMAICTAALRSWLLDHDAPVDKPLLAAIPVSIRTEDQMGTAGNQFSLMFSELPITEPDPEHRLKLMHSSMLEAKERFQSQPPTMLHHITSMLTPLLHGLTTRGLMRATASILPLTNLLVSNVPGPKTPVYLGGVRLLGNYPISALAETFGGLNITAVSYGDHVDFGILACSDIIEDAWEIARYLEVALSELAG
ncbi:wax ester/triacylglycerol synthase family O-acyltransferase [Nocardia sp. NPDC059246]|uniref:wax ester/triacylglycerol synthase family O-acyltransferase n=1 Tax=unclassified Nocardia TaxID=2637762 RepID=UPI0036A00D19